MIKRLKGKDFDVRKLSKEEEKRIKVFRDRGGFIRKVINPAGKGKAIIAQTGEQGYTIISIGAKRRTKIGRGLTEKSAIMRALGKGKKSITFSD